MTCHLLSVFFSPRLGRGYRSVITLFHILSTGLHEVAEYITRHYIEEKFTMRSRRKLIGILAAVVLMGVLPGVAAANTTEAIAETGGMTLTIPGVPVTVSVTLDQFGNIDTIGIDDTGFVATRTGKHKMRFSNGTTDGSTEIRIEADGEELSTELRTLNFADVLGDNVWTGDIFGTGDTTTVTFTVVQAGSGSETYAEITSVVVDTLFDFMVDGPETELTAAGVTSEAESEAEIEFFFDGFFRGDKRAQRVRGAYGTRSISISYHSTQDGEIVVVTRTT